jgi:hypothetical protein
VARQADLNRRTIIAAIPLVASGAALSACSSSPASGFRFFTSHQGAVVEDATARIAPGPRDDPAEAGHPGAREAGVVYYIDTMLAAFGEKPVPMIFAGGPWSARHPAAGRHPAGQNPAGRHPAAGKDLMASFIALDPVAEIAWRKRIGGWQQQYRAGIASLDKLADGDFTKAGPATQDKVLARPAVSAFLAILFEHTIEGLYANPEYGGNRDLAGWKDIGYPGDSQPRGYTPDEVSRSDGRAPMPDDPIVAQALKFLGLV